MGDEFKPVMPGNMLGVLGGGQLGRMFTLVAHQMGYKVTIVDPDKDSPAGRIADKHLCTQYDDLETLGWLTNNCAAVTTEFENVPANVLRELSSSLIVSPAAEAVEIAQNRIKEKTFLRDNGLDTAPFHPINNTADIKAACQQLPGATILKTARLGYDGKGQAVCSTPADVEQAFLAMGQLPCILEQRINIDIEISIILARGFDGQTACFPLAENTHKNAILDYTIAPARIDEKLKQEALTFATNLAQAMNYVGVLAVELFITTEGKVLINEIAPRPHNSGHYTQDATSSCQFEQQLRVLCRLPLGSTYLREPAVMINLLGDLWSSGEPDWATVLKDPHVKLHLYGKNTPKPGRKMGHLTYLSESTERAFTRAMAIQQSLMQ